MKSIKTRAAVAWAAGEPLKIEEVDLEKKIRRIIAGLEEPHLKMRDAGRSWFEDNSLEFRERLLEAMKLIERK